MSYGSGINGQRGMGQTWLC
ncbi:hypothetical protein Mgra_00006366 [Meloidogyne graminicola]|uniref:Uncharacterized protein n=1 Tax=Meloidogyne graminicola TaxID=189291 RepID=A0A8S9Z7H7_9BILA|nr:hypothetical protein Mgra_00010188 [Meloidogyne graminicola]KAF7634188.1 hypothetical protein Mgra_00006366 [Meloidogyne graminicola]